MKILSTAAALFLAATTAAKADDKTIIHITVMPEAGELRTVMSVSDESCHQVYQNWLSNTDYSVSWAKPQKDNTVIWRMDGPNGDELIVTCAHFKKERFE